MWPPSSIHYPQVFYPNVTPLCLSYSSNKGSKLQEQKNYWQSVKWSLSRTDAPHSWARLEAWCPLIMACPVSMARTEFYLLLLAAPRSRMSFTGQAGVYEDLSVLTPAPLRTWLSSHQPVWCSEWEQLENEARTECPPRLLSNITPKTDGYD